MAKVAEFISLEKEVFDIIGNRVKNISKEEKLEIVKELSVDKINMVDEKGDTLLYYSVVMGLTDVVRYLLSCPNIDVNKSNKSILDAAYIMTNKTNLKLLLKHPNIDINMKNNWGYTLLHFAVIYRLGKTIEIIRMILEFPNVDISFAMKEAKECKFEEVIKLLEEYSEKN